jgi:hypothetical protein
MWRNIIGEFGMPLNIGANPETGERKMKNTGIN